MGKVKVPELAVGVASKDLVIRPACCCLELSTMLVCLWAAGDKSGKEGKIQISQVSLLTRTLAEGRQKPGQGSVALASMFAILNGEPLNARSERNLDGHIIP